MGSVETMAQDRGPRGCHHQVSPSATMAHLRSWKTRVSRLPLEALKGEKSWVGVPASGSSPRQRTHPWSRLGNPTYSARAGDMATHPLSVPRSLWWDSPGSGDTWSWLQGRARHQGPGRSDKKGCHSPEDPSSLVARGGRGHPGEEETRVGGVLGGLPGGQHPGLCWSLTRSPGLPSLPSSPSKPAGPCRDRVRVSEGGWHQGALGGPEGPALGISAMGTGPWGKGPASGTSQEHYDTGGPVPSAPRRGMGGVLPGCLEVQGVRGALASLWGHACPRCPARATGGHGSSQDWTPLGHSPLLSARGMSGATLSPVAATHGSHLLGHGPWWPSWSNLPWETGGPLRRRGVLSEGGHSGGRDQPHTAHHLQTGAALCTLSHGMCLCPPQRNPPPHPHLAAWPVRT